MLSYSIYDTLLQTVRDRALDEMENLANLRGADFGEYRYRIGRIAGLRDAVTTIEEAMKKLQES